MDNILEAWDLNKWSVKDIQEIINMCLHTENLGVKLHDALSEHLRHREQSPDIFQKRNKYLKDMAGKLPKCPECGGVMWPYPVNTGARDQVGGDFRTQLMCGNTDCLHEEYRKETVEEIKKMLGTGG